VLFTMVILILSVSLWLVDTGTRCCAESVTPAPRKGKKGSNASVSRPMKRTRIMWGKEMYERKWVFGSPERGACRFTRLRTPKFSSLTNPQTVKRHGERSQYPLRVCNRSFFV